MSTNSLILFEGTSFADVRIIQIHGQPWFVGKDVCTLFGDKNHNRSLSRVSDDDKQMVTLDTKGGKQKMVAVNEAGLYTLLLGMYPQKANKDGLPYAYPQHIQERIEKMNQFRRWVTHEVLPSLRKRGTYMTDEARFRLNAKIDEMIAEHKARQREADIIDV